MLQLCLRQRLHDFRIRYSNIVIVQVLPKVRQMVYGVWGSPIFNISVRNSSDSDTYPYVQKLWTIWEPKEYMISFDHKIVIILAKFWTVQFRLVSDFCAEIQIKRLKFVEFWIAHARARDWSWLNYYLDRSNTKDVKL